MSFDLTDCGPTLADVLKMLDNIANSEEAMGLEDIKRLDAARETLGWCLGATFDEDSNRWTVDLEGELDDD